MSEALPVRFGSCRPALDAEEEEEGEEAERERSPKHEPPPLCLKPEQPLAELLQGLHHGLHAQLEGLRRQLREQQREQLVLLRQVCGQQQQQLELLQGMQACACSAPVVQVESMRRTSLGSVCSARPEELRREPPEEACACSAPVVQVESMQRSSLGSVCSARPEELPREPPEEECQPANRSPKATGRSITPLRRWDTTSTLGSPDASRLQTLVESNHFELVCGSVILLNALFMAAKMQWEGLQLHSPGEVRDSWVENFFRNSHIVFMTLFIIELTLRLSALRLKFFKSGWNLLDFAVVLYGVIELAGLGNEHLDPGMVRLLRLIKLTRLLKMLNKAAHFLDDLNLIIKSVLASRTTLSWAMMILFSIQWMISMVLGQMAQNTLHRLSTTSKEREEIFDYYGTFSKTMITMFEVTHANYAPPARVLMRAAGEHFAWFFVVYRVFVSFAVLNVIRAVFIQQTLKVAERDKDLIIRTKSTAEKKFNNELRRLFVKLTGSSRKELTWETWQAATRESRMKDWMTTLDLGYGDMEGIFDLLDRNGDGHIQEDEFVRGAAKLKGAARAIDLFHVVSSVQKMEKNLDTVLIGPLMGKRHTGFGENRNWPDKAEASGEGAPLAVNAEADSNSTQVKPAFRKVSM